MPTGPREKPHLRIEGGGVPEGYTSPRLAITGLPPARIRAQHATRLQAAVAAALAAGRVRIAARDPQIAEGEPGLYLQFDLPIAHRDAVEALENKPKAIRLRGRMTPRCTAPSLASQWQRPKPKRRSGGAPSAWQ